LVSVGAIERLRAVDFGAGRYLSVTEGGVLFSHGSSESSNIYRLPFDAEFRRVSGDPIPLIVGAGFNFSATASEDGRRIAFAVGSNLSNAIWRVPVDPASGTVSGAPVRVTSGVDPSRTPSPSRDGKRLAYLGGSRKSPEIRIRDLVTGTDQRLAEAKEWSYLVLSPDSSQVAFSSDQRPKSAIYSVPAAGGVPKRLCGGCGRPVEWIADRTKLLIDNAGPNERDIHILDVATGQSKPLLQHSEFQLTMPRLSPDGKVMSFTQVRPGQARRIYLVPFTGELVPEQEWSVLLDASTLDRQPAWPPAGSTLYFLSDRDGARCIWAQRVDTTTRRPVGSPFAAHHMHQFRYNLRDVDPAAIGLSLADGQMFYPSFDLESNIWLAERQERTAR
jgi:Tol biopolymer transport system component